MFSWLDDHSGSVVALATIALAVITAIYVALTRRLASSSADLVETTRATLIETRRMNQHAQEANRLSEQAVDLQVQNHVRRQASLVSAWPAKGYKTTGAQTAVAVVHFSNRSGAPVFDCSFMILYEGRGSTHPGSRPMIGPEESGEIEIHIGASVALTDEPQLTFEFRDNAGMRWRRDPRGALTQLDAD